MPTIKNHICPTCKLSKLIIRDNVPILEHIHYMKSRPLDPIYGYIKLCEVGQCVSVETDKPAYMQRVCFIANKMFANEGKRFTSRYDKAKGIGYVWRIEPGSKYDYNIHKK